MRAKIAGPVLVAALLILAGCTGGVPTGTPSPATSTQGDGSTGSGMNPSSGTGHIAVYVSDEPNAIGDFEHLNVTITKVGLHRVEADTRNASSSPQPTTGQNASNATVDAGEADRPNTDGNEGWQEYEVERTVDLTWLVGANASKLGVFDAPVGTYNKVFLYVAEINATTTNGEQVKVKLPSERLHINQAFTIGGGEEVDFVFDIAPHKAGQSGKYILKPVISESGPGENVEITDVDEPDDEEAIENEDVEDEKEGDESEDEDAEADDDASEKLTAEFTSPVTRGETTSVLVRAGEDPVSGATVTVNDERVGQTGAAGVISFSVPASSDELEVVVTHGETEVELSVELPDSGSDR